MSGYMTQGYLHTTYASGSMAFHCVCPHQKLILLFLSFATPLLWLPFVRGLQILVVLLVDILYRICPKSKGLKQQQQYP